MSRDDGFILLVEDHPNDAAPIKSRWCGALDVYRLILNEAPEVP